MAGFSEQRTKLRSALIASGIPADAATKIASVLGNSAQALRHSGDVTTDTTPSDMRQVDGQSRRVRFPNIDDRTGDPDHRRRRTKNSEKKRKKTQAPNVTKPQAPQADPNDAPFGIAPGQLTDVGVIDDTAIVGVRHVPAGRPVAGLPVAMVDSPTNQLVSKAPRAKVNANDGSLRLDIRENQSEVIWSAQMLNRSEFDVVTKIEHKTGVGLVITYAKVNTWGRGNAKRTTIRTVSQPVVSDIIDDKNGMRGKRSTVSVLDSTRKSPSFFNVFRIGTFTGGWNIGAEKQVTQKWPQCNDAQVWVINLTQSVPDTPEEKYVIYAVRTQDASFGANDDPRPQGPVPTRPTAAYYALEIQGSPGGAEPAYTTVLTDVALTGGGLVFTRKKCYAWFLDDTDKTITTTDCPTV